MTDLTTPFHDCPLWLAHLLRLLPLDTHEVAGPGNNPEILRVYEDLGVNPAVVNDDRDPWCSVCGAACYRRAGLPYPVRFRAARSFCLFGEHCESRLGAGVILDRIDPKHPKEKHGHFGFDLVSAENARIVLNHYRRPLPKNIDEPGLIWLACGNTSNRVGVAGYDAHRLLDRRWPTKDMLARAGLNENGQRTP